MVLAALLACARAASAQTALEAPREVRARSAFDEGVRLSRERRWIEALDAFERSRALHDRPSAALNVAIALRELGRLRAARRALRECIAMPQIAEEPDLGRDAALLLGLVGDAIPTLSVVVVPSRAGVRVDDEPAPDPRAIELDPGRHTVTVSAPTRATEAFVIEVRAGDHPVRTVHLRALPAEVEVDATPFEADVFVNGALMGQGRARWQGAAGAIRLRVTSAGHEEAAREIVVAPGARVTERFALTPVRRPFYARPWFWVGVGAAVAVAAGVAVVVSATREVPTVDGGSTGAVLFAY